MRGVVDLITQLCFYVHCAEGIKVDASWGYWFYAALMEHLPSDVAEQFHQSDRTPLSQYLRLPTRENCPLDWVVNVFGDDVEAAIVPPPGWKLLRNCSCAVARSRFIWHWIAAFTMKTQMHSGIMSPACRMLRATSFTFSRPRLLKAMNAS